MDESLGQRMRRLRGTSRESAMREVVTEWRASGKSQAAFCRDVGIATVTLGRWVRRLEAGKVRESGEPVLVEVGVHENGHEAVFDVVLSNGVLVSVPSGFRESDLTRLLGVLSAAC